MADGESRHLKVLIADDRQKYFSELAAAPWPASRAPRAPSALRRGPDAGRDRRRDGREADAGVADALGDERPGGHGHPSREQAGSPVPARYRERPMQLVEERPNVELRRDAD